MIRLGARLVVAGGREAIARLMLIVVAVSIGAGLLLATLASVNAVKAQNDRYAWLETGFGPSAHAHSDVVDPAWWELRADYFEGEQIGRVDVAATGRYSPVPPGISALPGPGELYASPAMAALLRDTPAGELADRYPGKLIGTIRPEGLPSPDSLIIVVGHDADSLAQDGKAQLVTGISTTVPSDCRSGGCAVGVGINADGITLILAVVAALLVVPVLIFIGGASRLSAARREERFAAMRLIGATPRQISVISTVESCIAAVMGVGLGFALFFAMRPALAQIPFTGSRFYSADLALSWGDVLFVGLGIPVAAAIAARVALRRVNVSPLGVTRRVTPPPPHAWRIIPLVVGVVALAFIAYFTDIGPSKNTDAEVVAYLSTIVAIMVGLVIAGPWLTMVGSRTVARRARRAATLIAGRRLSDDPRAGFRAVSGLVMAVFVGSLIVGVITTIVDNNAGKHVGDRAPGAVDTVIYQFNEADPALAQYTVPEAVMSTLTDIDGVTGVAVIHAAPGTESAYGTGIVSCAQLAGTPQFGRCPAGAGYVKIDPDYGGAVVENSSSMADTTWPSADTSDLDIGTLRIQTIAVGTDGSTAAIERARTVLANHYDGRFPPITLAEFSARSTRLLDQYQQLANVVLLVSLPIAGCSLAVSVAGGLADRRRPFSLLRLAGTPLAVLRRVVTLEAVVPLLMSAAVAAVVGFVTAFLFLHAQMSLNLRAPGLTYYVFVVAGIVASLAVIASCLPLLRRMTGPEAARND